MRGVYKIRTARKRHQCTEAGHHDIEPGDRYLCGECPPEHEMNQSRKTDPGGRKWWIIRACLRCAERYGLHSSDTRKQLEELSTCENPDRKDEEA